MKKGEANGCHDERNASSNKDSKSALPQSRSMVDLDLDFSQTSKSTGGVRKYSFLN